MSMNLHLLRLFTAVADHDGVATAARALRLSQPAISRAIRELERQLGVSLFERSTRRVRLTPEGAEIYRQARGVFAAERAVEESVAALKGLKQGTLHIGASTTIATYVLPGFIGAFARSHPQVEIRLSAVHTRVIVDLLRRYELDVALAEAPVTDPDVAVTPWRVDEMVVIAAAGHHLAKRRKIAPSELSDELFLLREPESGTRSIVLSALAGAHVTVRRSMSIDGTEVIKQAVAEGLGIAVVSRSAIADQLATGRLAVLHVDGLRVQRPFNHLALRDRRPSSVARAFDQLIQPPGATDPVLKGVRSRGNGARSATGGVTTT
jgi:DNA-binding transcriptional LysR family regulator